jgi:hypothetical protein
MTTCSLIGGYQNFEGTTFVLRKWRQQVSPKRQEHVRDSYYGFLGYDAVQSGGWMLTYWERITSVIHLSDGGSRFLRNFGARLPERTVS